MYEGIIKEESSFFFYSKPQITSRHGGLKFLREKGRPKKRNFLVNVFKKCLKTPFFGHFFSVFSKFPAAKKMNPVFSERSENQLSLKKPKNFSTITEKPPPLLIKFFAHGNAAVFLFFFRYPCDARSRKSKATKKIKSSLVVWQRKKNDGLRLCVDSKTQFNDKGKNEDTQIRTWRQSSTTCMQPSFF